MSESAAGKRITAARVARRFPVVLEMIARGEIHLTAVNMLAAHLTEENHAEVLWRARHRSKRDLEKLVAELAPRPDVPSRVLALPHRAAAQPVHAPERVAHPPERVAARPAVVAPLLLHPFAPVPPRQQLGTRRQPRTIRNPAPLSRPQPIPSRPRLRRRLHGGKEKGCEVRCSRARSDAVGVSAGGVPERARAAKRRDANGGEHARASPKGRASDTFGRA